MRKKRKNHNYGYCACIKKFSREQNNITQNVQYVVNKPLPAAGLLQEIMSAADRLSEKWTAGQELKL